MEKILIKSKFSKKGAFALLVIAGIFLLVGLILLFTHVSKYSNYREDWDWGGYPWTIPASFFEYSSNAYWAIGFFVIALFFVIFFLILRKMQIVVTDKRTYGKTFFGRSVDLPMDSITAVVTSPREARCR